MSDQPTEAIHGHEVMQMMMQSGQFYTRAGLIETIKERFGEQQLFYTCNDQDLTPDALISFLERMGKFEIKDDQFRMCPDGLCNH